MTDDDDADIHHSLGKSSESLFSQMRRIWDQATNLFNDAGDRIREEILLGHSNQFYMTFLCLKKTGLETLINSVYLAKNGRIFIQG